MAEKVRITLVKQQHKVGSSHLVVVVLVVRIVGMIVGRIMRRIKHTSLGHSDRLGRRMSTVGDGALSGEVSGCHFDEGWRLG